MNRKFSGLLLLLLFCLPVSADSFWIGSRDDRIVVYRANDPEPYQISDAIVPRLPQRDRQRLSSGFTVEGEEAMRRVMEDYTG